MRKHKVISVTYLIKDSTNYLLLKVVRLKEWVTIMYIRMQSQVKCFIKINVV